jgi:hypothetical protein
MFDQLTACISQNVNFYLLLGQSLFLSARKADLIKGFQHLVVVVLVVLLLVLVVGTRVKKRF